MCGIAGIFDVNGRSEIDLAKLHLMNATLAHRGPDGDGVHREPGIGLAHRRLSIIDLEGGGQPMWNEDRTVGVVFNGEIYNFREVMAELVSRGHKFQSRCDTEVLVHAWEEWGQEFTTRLRGMFAFALWDRKREALVLARDRLGIKPLYYALLGHRLAFASELKALLALGGLGDDLDPHAVEEYFALGYVPEPRTILRGASKLPPAGLLVVQRGRPVPRPSLYWDVPLEKSHSASEALKSGELMETISEAVRLHMIADVPVGAFLSGGVDSSTVVALMSREAIGPITACSIGFTDARFDESAHAARVAQLCGARHMVGGVAPEEPTLAATIGCLYDEPFADSSAIPTYQVCRMARQHVKVALSGDGADEAFAGYPRYRWHVRESGARQWVPRWGRTALFGGAARVCASLGTGGAIARARATLEALSRDPIAAYLNSVSVTDDDVRRRIFSGRFRTELQGYDAREVLRRHFTACSGAPPLTQVQYVDLKTYLPGDILTKVDRASMAHSLEVRVPFVDHQVVEWALALPADLKLRGRQGKYLLKHAMRNYLPEDLLYRPKMGFAVPLDAWFRGPLLEPVRQSITSERLLDQGVFEAAALRAIVDEHASGRAQHGQALWALMMFDAFLQNRGQQSTGIRAVAVNG